jgi:hypothetical protein
MKGCIKAHSSLFPAMANETWTNVNVTNRLNFSGNGSIVSPAPVFDGSFTEIVKFTTGSDVTTLQGLTGCHKAGLTHNYGIYIVNGKVFYSYIGNELIARNKSFTVVKNTTYTLAMTTYNGLCYCYKDGVYFDLFTALLPYDSTVKHYIGAYSNVHNNPAYFFTGSIDFQATFNRSFTAEEHKQIYEMLKEPYAYYYFESDAGLFDWSFNAPNKTWIFPDGTTSTEDRPAKTLDAPGTVILRMDSYNDQIGNYSLASNNSKAGYLGNAKDLPRCSQNMIIAYLSNMTGSYADLPRVQLFFSLIAINLNGSLQDCPSTNYFFRVLGTTITGALQTMNATSINLSYNSNIDITNSIININTAGTSNGTFQATGSTPAPDYSQCQDAIDEMTARGWTFDLNT